jgi:hypothetical protein
VARLYKAAKESGCGQNFKGGMQESPDVDARVIAYTARELAQRVSIWNLIGSGTSEDRLIATLSDGITLAVRERQVGRLVTAKIVHRYLMAGAIILWLLLR